MTPNQVLKWYIQATSDADAITYVDDTYTLDQIRKMVDNFSGSELVELLSQVLQATHKNGEIAAIRRIVRTGRHEIEDVKNSRRQLALDI